MTHASGPRDELRQINDRKAAFSSLRRCSGVQQRGREGGLWALYSCSRKCRRSQLSSGALLGARTSGRQCGRAQLTRTQLAQAFGKELF